LRPVKTPKKDVPHYIHAAGVIVRRTLAPHASAGVGTPPQEEVLLAQRPSTGLLGGLWEFPNGRVEGDPAKELTKVLRSGYNLQLRLKRKSPELGVLQHAYTHFEVTVHPFR